MIYFDEAAALIAQYARPIGQESVPISAAAGRFLAAAVYAAIDNPRCDTSAMDGYAVTLGDAQTCDGAFNLVGESRPGAPFTGVLQAGEAVRIFTGAPIPQGADRVLVQEIVAAQSAQIRLSGTYGAARHIRHKASDFGVGDALLPPGLKLDYRALVAAGGADAGALTVHLRPRIGFIATGDELVQPGEAAAKPFAIPESLSPALAAMAADYGAVPVHFAREIDDLARLEKAADEALDVADLVVVTGGASVGAHDHSKAMFAAHGLELIFNKVLIKPGKPVWFGKCGGKLVLGLPGNPTSALVTARLFLAPLLHGLSGGDAAQACHWRALPLGADLPATGGRETFRRARLQAGKLVMMCNQDSGAQSPLVQADWLVRCPAGDTGFAATSIMQALAF